MKTAFGKLDEQSAEVEQYAAKHYGHADREKAADKRENFGKFIGRRRGNLRRPAGLKLYFARGNAAPP